MNSKPYDSSTRNYVIDFTKGFLVITMVVYHTLNYYAYGKHMISNYVSYVVQAFIFYSGFMVGTIYFDKFRKNKKYVYFRLLTRASKLVIIFFVLNLTIYSLFDEDILAKNRELGIESFFNNFYSVLLIGGERIGRFPILLPIAYVLIISCLLIHLSRIKCLLYILLLSSFCVISFCNINISYNLMCTLTGIGGLFTGLICSNLGSIPKKNLINYMLILSLFFYVTVVIPSGIDVRDYVIVYFLYINLIVANLYLLGSYLDPSKIITKVIIKFGQYSLILYLAQIFFLQIMKRIIDFRLGFITIDHILIFIFINMLLIICCYSIDYFRNKNVFVDKAYRFIFS